MRQIGPILIVVITLTSIARVGEAGTFRHGNARSDDYGAGGAGTVALIYSEKADPSAPFCTDYDLIIGLQNGEVLLEPKSVSCGKGLELLRHRPYLTLSVISVGIP